MNLYGLHPKKCTGHWLGVAHNLGDSLTYWVLDYQSKQVLARSVVRPCYANHHVTKWDPALVEPKFTSHNGVYIIPDKQTQERSMDTSFDAYDEMEQNPEPREAFHNARQASLDKVKPHLPILNHVPDNYGLDMLKMGNFRCNKP